MSNEYIDPIAVASADRSDEIPPTPWHVSWAGGNLMKYEGNTYVIPLDNGEVAIVDENGVIIETK